MAKKPDSFVVSCHLYTVSENADNAWENLWPPFVYLSFYFGLLLIYSLFMDLVVNLHSDQSFWV
ncbi:unnamed protein product [Camellia sinensis]